jgi:nucleoside-diphosphate-sugar epimerase
MVPDIGFGIVDVADISAMHLAALERPESVGHRFIGSNGTMTMPRIAQHLAARIPTGASPRGSRRSRFCGCRCSTLRSAVSRCHRPAPTFDNTKRARGAGHRLHRAARGDRPGG